MLAARGQQPLAPTVPTNRLSKSRFLAGLQCPKRLYLEIHAPFLATRPDGAMRAILDLGHEVGEVARRRFPGGVLVEADHRHPLEAVLGPQAPTDDPRAPALFYAPFT